MERMAEMIRQIAALAVLTAAIEMLLPDGPGKRGVELLAGLAMSLAVAGLLPGVGIW